MNFFACFAVVILELQTFPVKCSGFDIKYLISTVLCTSDDTQITAGNLESAGIMSSELCVPSRPVVRRGLVRVFCKAVIAAVLQRPAHLQNRRRLESHETVQNQHLPKDAHRGFKRRSDAPLPQAVPVEAVKPPAEEADVSMTTPHQHHQTDL